MDTSPACVLWSSNKQSLSFLSIEMFFLYSVKMCIFPLLKGWKPQTIFPSDIELLTKNQTMKKSPVILQLDSYGVFQISLSFIAFEIPYGQERIILPLSN